MNCVSRVVLGLFAAMVMAPVAQAEGLPEPTPVPLPAAKPFVWEVGARYWYSTGKTGYDLFDSTGGTLISRLTYDDLTAHSGELFFRGDHRSGFFAKGNFGAGKLNGGALTDEDFPPVVVPYSSTNSTQDGGSLRYLSIDLGYTFVDTNKSSGGLKDNGQNVPGIRIGAFAGYQYLNESLHAFGCIQQATSPICVAVPVAPGTAVISQESTWHSLRLGVVAEVQLSSRVKLTGEAAYLRASLDAADTHHLRIGVPTPANTLFNGPTPQDGTGNGVQLEAILTYRLTDSFDVGIGGRYWRLESDGLMHFETSRAPAAALPQVLKFETERYGAFVQGSLRF